MTERRDKRARPGGSEDSETRMLRALAIAAGFGDEKWLMEKTSEELAEAVNNELGKDNTETRSLEQQRNNVSEAVRLMKRSLRDMNVTVAEESSPKRTKKRHNKKSKGN